MDLELETIKLCDCLVSNLLSFIVRIDFPFADTIACICTVVLESHCSTVQLEPKSVASSSCVLVETRRNGNLLAFVRLFCIVSAPPFNIVELRSQTHIFDHGTTCGPPGEA